MRYYILFSLCWLVAAVTAEARQQTTPFQETSLTDLSGFAPAEANWQIAGRVMAGRFVEHDISIDPGTGVLVNNQTEEARGHLFTAWAHADMELDVEVLMPHGSNSGIYFQSRYEIQLFDSWGIAEPGMSDIGGIYQRWDESRPDGQKGYEGHAPAVNVARAPGLWQHLNIVFKAPRFDEDGNKIQDARFVKVTLNGVVIHENVDVTGPTRAAAFEDEVARAPLMIQGDHGPVAFRHMRFRLFDVEPVRLSDLRHVYYEGQFTHQMPDVRELERKTDEEVTSITVQNTPAQNEFAVQHTGNLYIPTQGAYQFEVSHTARFRLFIDGRQVLGDNDQNVAGVGEFDRRETTLMLDPGEHTFEITYAKGLWHSVPTAMGWYVSGPGILRTELTAPGSLPADAFGAYRLDPGETPVLQRNFVMHAGEPRTHAISVAFPGGIHYAYDMSLGTLLHVWKGPFVDTSTMWYQRGYMQSAVPIGSLIEQAGAPTILIADENSPGGVRAADAYRFENYRLTDKGLPVFNYRVGSASISDRIEPDPDSRFFTRTLTIDSSGESGSIRCVLMESDVIEDIGEGEFLIGDQKMYLEVEEGNVSIQTTQSGMQLVAPIASNDAPAHLKYRLIW